MTLIITFGGPICWRPVLVRGYPFLGWRFCWLLVAVAGYPMQDDELFKLIHSDMAEWKTKR